MIAVILFYNISRGIQSVLSFNEEFRHCNSIVFDGENWIMLEFDNYGFLLRKIECNNADRFIRTLRSIPEATCIISVNIEDKAKIRWKPFIVRSCNEMVRYTTGVDIGWTFNPIHFYNKLIKYNHIRNYEILSHWRRSWDSSMTVAPIELAN